MLQTAQEKFPSCPLTFGADNTRSGAKNVDPHVLPQPKDGEAYAQWLKQLQFPDRSNCRA